MKDGQAYRIPEKQLQDKSHRPYVQESLQISPDTFYTSQFDLNMENGQIETPPIKPMLRFISHFIINGESWLISLNYQGRDYLAELDNQYNWSDGQSWLVNNEGGNWLLGPTSDSAWQFMPSRQNTQGPRFLPDTSCPVGANQVQWKRPSITR